MDTQNKTNEQNALAILAKASAEYLKHCDELAKSFVEPQVNMAIQILNALLTSHYADAGVESPDKSANNTKK